MVSAREPLAVHPNMTPDECETWIRNAMFREDWAFVDQLEATLREMLGSTTIPGILPSALWYAQQGLHVFPLQAGAKVPHPGTRGCKDATDDEDRIRAWWQRWPDSNVAIATGHQVDVIDIDGPAGVKSWAVGDNMPETFGVVSTPRRGGTHLYVAATGKGNQAAMRPGIDYRGVGGYVVAPPSVGLDARLYRWRRPLDVAALKAAS